MTPHKFESSGWDNYDCRHCDVSAYTAKHEHCEEEPGFKSTYMTRRQAEQAKMNPLLRLFRGDKA